MIDPPYRQIAHATWSIGLVEKVNSQKWTTCLVNNTCSHIMNSPSCRQKEPTPIQWTGRFVVIHNKRTPLVKHRTNIIHNPRTPLVKHRTNIIHNPRTPLCEFVYSTSRLITMWELALSTKRPVHWIGVFLQWCSLLVDYISSMFYQWCSWIVDYISSMFYQWCSFIVDYISSMFYQWCS
jgi:uncharacterized membrane protein YecN with MAPEG domain